MEKMKIIFICITLYSLLYGNIFAQGQTSLALKLDGDGDYVEFGNVTEANFVKSDFTIEFWINKSTTRLEAIIGKRDICSHSSFWNSRIASSINFELDQNNIGSNYLILGGTGNIADSSWHHIAITRKGSVIKLYLDSVLDQTGSSGDTTSVSNAASLLIGDNPCIGTIDGTSNFTGQIDEVRIWRTARTANQIQSTMNDTLAPKYYTSSDSGLFGYWRFNQLEDLGIMSDGVDDIRDFSIYGNHGDLVGDAILIQSDNPLSLEDMKLESPKRFSLKQNYPNPFNPATTINYYLATNTNISLKIYDITGKEIAALLNEHKTSGSYSVKFDASQLPSGIYLYRLKTSSGLSQTRRMLLLK